LHHLSRKLTEPDQLHGLAVLSLSPEPSDG
jgi:hypothetical protein